MGFNFLNSISEPQAKTQVVILVTLGHEVFSITSTLIYGF